MRDGEPRIGLVLGAGGEAGAAFHAGVLAALQEATGWDPRTASVIVGTSAGSITGAGLRAGLAAPDLLARAQGRPVTAEAQQVLRRVGSGAARPPLRPRPQGRPPAAVATTLARAARRPLAARPWALMAALLPEGQLGTEVISDGISGLFPDAWPGDPLWICAVRQGDGRRVVFGRDGLRPTVSSAVAASCAIPSFFSPVEVHGDLHIDGGVHSPTNADVLLDARPFDLVLVSSPMSRQGRRPRMASDEAMRAWSGALLAAEVRQLRRRDVPVLAFQPDEAVVAAVGGNAMDPTRRPSIATATRSSALEKLARTDVATRLEALS